MEDLYKTDCIRTFTGKYLNIFAPTEEMICLEDIAHGLSHQPRFSGQTKYFYSVAQHSLFVSDNTEAPHKLAALLHDASEAYLMDIPSPIKRRMPIYKVIEDGLMRVIAAKFGFQYPLNFSVKDNDKIALELEWDHVMLNRPTAPALFYLGHSAAKKLFIDAYYRIV